MGNARAEGNRLIADIVAIVNAAAEKGVRFEDQGRFIADLNRDVIRDERNEITKVRYTDLPKTEVVVQRISEADVSVGPPQSARPSQRNYNPGGREVKFKGNSQQAGAAMRVLNMAIDPEYEAPTGPPSSSEATAFFKRTALIKVQKAAEGLKGSNPPAR